ncbi:MAG: alkaline phosphatase [Planctomycetes bacterium]|nr:alkaline phosphatase [Planctomycetota bacterium]
MTARFFSFGLTVLLVSWALKIPSVGDQPESPQPGKPAKIRNIVLMIGDGMGIAHLTLARLHKGRLAMEEAENFGLSATSSLNAFVTDSSASATALGTGYLIQNGVVGQHPNGKTVKTILEYAEEKGLWTGVVVTCRVTHATPASMATHVSSRGSEDDIALQLSQKDLEVIFGGGWDKFLPRRIESVRAGSGEASGARGIFTAVEPERQSDRTPSRGQLLEHPRPLIDAAGSPYGGRKDGKNLLKEMASRGYRSIRTAGELATITLGPPGKVIGLFHSEAMPPAREGRSPSLVAMTHSALSILSQSPQGFFLMVEGSQIDWGAHQNSADYAMTEAADFDDAVGEVFRFLKESRLLQETLVVITADHETGGLSINPHPQLAFGFEAKWTTKGHTGIPVPVFSAGPASDRFAGFQSHAEIGRKLIEGLLDRKLVWDYPGSKAASPATASSSTGK